MPLPARCTRTSGHNIHDKAHEAEESAHHGIQRCPASLLFLCDYSGVGILIAPPIGGGH